jgi:two-component system, OmpR family, response regulator
MTRHVLVVEDEPEIAKLVERHLQDLSCRVELAFDGNAGLAAAQSGAFDLIILDLMLPGIDGLEICRRLRGQARYTPILMLTAKSNELDRVLGLEMGADDYLAKPFSFPELLARVKAIFRRVDALAAARDATPALIAAGELSIDPGRREVMRHGRTVELTPKEFDLLLHFAQNPGIAYTRAQLLDLVWGYRYEGYEHAVNCHINRLRAKIEDDQAKPRQILTVWGVGYKFADTARG